ncbi:MAG: patatin-like phospholipase family protein [bacterium]|nr:patatin-like phospholipase family protein [bacterium]
MPTPIGSYPWTAAASRPDDRHHPAAPDRHPGLERLLDGADLLAGTSTGGLLALGLAKGLDLELLRRTYVEKGPRIFDDSWLDDVMDLGKLRGADYSITNLKRELQTLLGDTTLDQLHKRVLITTFDLDNEDPRRRTWKPKLFHHFPGPNSDGAHLARNVALYTSAAPVLPLGRRLHRRRGLRRQPRDVRAGAVAGPALFPHAAPGRGRAAVAGHRDEPQLHQGRRPQLGLRAVDQAPGQHHARRHRRHRRLPVPPDPGRPLPPPGPGLPPRHVHPHGRRRPHPYMTDYAQSLDLTATIDWLKATW